MEEFEQRNFTIDDDNNNLDSRMNMQKINMSKDYYNSLNTNNSHNTNNANKNNFQQGNYMPDHIAEKLISDILNDKFD